MKAFRINLDDQLYAEHRTVAYYANRTMTSMVREALKDKLRDFGRGEEDYEV